MAGETAAAKPACEHYWADHCHDGLSVRLCQFCHEPEWDDLRRQLEGAAAGEHAKLAALRAAAQRVLDDEELGRPRWAPDVTAVAQLRAAMNAT